MRFSCFSLVNFHQSREHPLPRSEITVTDVIAVVGVSAAAHFIGPHPVFEMAQDLRRGTACHWSGTQTQACTHVPASAPRLNSASSSISQSSEPYSPQAASKYPGQASDH